MSHTAPRDLIAARHLFITQRLRLRRDELGLTQKQIVTRLARCGLHTTNRALSSLEHGAGIDVAKLPELARALDCTVTYLIGLTDDPHSWHPDSPADRASEQAIVAPPVGAAPAEPALAAGLPAQSLMLGAYLPQDWLPRRAGHAAHKG